MTNELSMLLVSGGVALVAGLFSGLFGRRLEEWWLQPRLSVEFLQGEGGFLTEGRWKEDGTEIAEIYVRARVRNVGRGRIARKCRPYLVKLEEVHPSGTTQTSYHDSLVLPWPLRDYAPRDIPQGVNQFFDIVGVLRHRQDWRFTFRERFTGYERLPEYRGTYRFTVLVTGDHVKPAGRRIDVTYDGNPKNLRAVDAGPA